MRSETGEFILPYERVVKKQGQLASLCGGVEIWMGTGDFYLMMEGVSIWGKGSSL